MTTATVDTLDIRPANGQTNAVQRRTALGTMATRFSMDPTKLLDVLKATVIKTRNGRAASNEEVAAFVVVANQYDLNPFTREIYAFENKGAIIPIVSIDGWAKTVNRSAGFDGCDFEYMYGDNGQPIAVTCIMHCKGRSHPVKVTEWMNECKRPTEPWNMMPARMLRHKAFIQAARYAFGLGGIYDEDEGRDIIGDVPVESKPSLADRVAQQRAAIAEQAAADEPVTTADELPVFEAQDAEQGSTEGQPAFYDEAIDIMVNEAGCPDVDTAKTRLFSAAIERFDTPPGKLTDDQWRELTAAIRAGELTTSTTTKARKSK